MHTLVGKSLEEARAWASPNNLSLRVVRQDGKSVIITMDLRGDRVNVAIVKNMVTEVGIG